MDFSVNNILPLVANYYAPTRVYEEPCGVRLGRGRLDVDGIIA